MSIMALELAGLLNLPVLGNAEMEIGEPCSIDKVVWNGLSFIGMVTPEYLKVACQAPVDFVLVCTSEVAEKFLEARPESERAITVLDLVRQSLQGQVVLSTNVGLEQPFRLDLSKLFSGQFISLRPFLPTFDSRGHFDFTHFPDPTFGGTALDLTQLEISRALLGDDCEYDVPAANQAECDAAKAQRSCRSDYFYPWPGYTDCYLSGCICGWSGD